MFKEFAIIAAIIAGSIAIIAAMSYPILKWIIDDIWRNKFSKDVRQAIMRGPFPYEDFQHMAERWQQDRKSMLLTLRMLHSSAMSGRDSDLPNHIESIRELLIKHQEQEPYSELPENIGIQLAALAAVDNEVERAAVNQLASSLSELYVKNQKRLQMQSRYSYIGVIVGVVSIAVAFYLVPSGA